MPNLIPDKLINFKAYHGEAGLDLLGTVDVTLPKIEYETEELRGAGIPGTIEAPSLGQTKAMSCEINFRTVTERVIQLSAPSGHQLSFYGALQLEDSGTGAMLSRQCRAVIKTLPKTVETGKFDPSKPMESKAEFEVWYYKLAYDGMDLLEIDKLNGIHFVNGFDHLAQVRADMGMA